MSYCYCANCKHIHGNCHFPWWLNRCNKCGEFPHLLFPPKREVPAKYVRDSRWDVLAHAVHQLEELYGQPLSSKQVAQMSSQFVALGMRMTTKNGRPKPDLSQISIEGTHLVFAIEPNHDFKVCWSGQLSEFLAPEPEPVAKGCTCDINTLMAKGCQCGQFKREQKGKDDESSVSVSSSCSQSSSHSECGWGAIMDNIEILKYEFL